MEGGRMNAQEYIDIIQESTVELSGWEEDFLESIQVRLDNGKELTPAQEDKLRQIYDKAVIR